MNYSIPLLLLLSTTLLACGPDTSRSTISSADLPEMNRIDDDAVHYSTSNDKDFCKNRPATECFTFILAIPSPELEGSLSLGALALSLGAEKFRLPALRACNKSIEAYARGYQAHSTTLRARFFSRIRETRCLVDVIRRETYELPPLPQGQSGIAFRLAGWDVLGSVIETKISPLSCTIQSAFLGGAYRNAAIFNRAEGETDSKWHDLYAKEFRPFGGLRPLETRIFSKTFSKQLIARFSTIESLEILEQTIEKIQKDQVDFSSVERFLAEAKMAVSELIAGNRSKASMAMLAIAIDAIKTIRRDDLMESSLVSHNVVEAMQKQFGSSEVIDSSINALFYDSHLILPGMLIDDAFKAANSGQLMRALDIPSVSPEEPAEPF